MKLVQRVHRSNSSALFYSTETSSVNVLSLLSAAREVSETCIPRIFAAVLPCSEDLAQN